jgi:hypothetical protein
MSIPHIESQRSETYSDTPDGGTSGDMLVNNLQYKQPSSLSLAVNRTFHRQYFQRSSYEASQTAICDINSGTSYCNADNSYLTFTVRTKAGEANLASAGGMAFIREIKLRSRSGTEIDRVERANLWSKIDVAYSMPDSYLKKFGASMGFGSSRTGAGDPANVSDTADLRVAIPLRMLSPFFRGVKKQLIPASILSGLHVEITWEDYRTALFEKTGAVTGYTITNPEFVLDLVELTDDTQKTLGFESASSGLELTYPRIHTSVTSQNSGDTSCNIQVRKAVSQASLVYAITLDQADVLDVTKDSFASVGWDVTNWQWKCGSLFFPHQTLTDPNGDGVESYLMAQNTWDKNRHPFAESSVGLTEFKTGGCGVVATSLEKDCNLNLSGLPINNSRSIELNMTYSAVAANREVVLFLEYISVCKSYVDNVSVAM